MIAGLLLHPLGYAVLMTACVGIMVVEFYRMSLADRNRTGQVFGFLSSVLIFITAYTVARNGLWASRFWLLSLPLPVTTAWITVLYHRSEDAFRSAALLFLPLIYIAVPFSIFNFISFNALGMFQGFYLLALFIVLWASDIGGYLIGMGFGQKNGHKLFPSISPKKILGRFCRKYCLCTGGRLCPLQAGHVAVRMVPLHDTGLYHQRFRSSGGFDRICHEKAFRSKGLREYHARPRRAPGPF